MWLQILTALQHWPITQPILIPRKAVGVHPSAWYIPRREKPSSSSNWMSSIITPSIPKHGVINALWQDGLCGLLGTLLLSFPWRDLESCPAHAGEAMISFLLNKKMTHKLALDFEKSEASSSFAMFFLYVILIACHLFGCHGPTVHQPSLTAQLLSSQPSFSSPACHDRENDA